MNHDVTNGDPRLGEITPSSSGIGRLYLDGLSCPHEWQAQGSARGWQVCRRCESRCWRDAKGVIIDFVGKFYVAGPSTHGAP